MKKRLQTLAVAALIGGGGFVAGTQLTTVGNDRVIRYIGSTAVAHAVDLRKEPGDGGVAVQVYGTVLDTNGAAHDLGGSACVVSADEQTGLTMIMQSPVARSCASVDSGVTGVHAIDFRQRASADGGRIATMQVYGNRVTSDGGAIYPPSGTCDVPVSWLRVLDVVGLKCFMKSAGLGK